jgi:NAD(P)-dependent dehydrogenase (short-subunit alcohol dehydrogenase family)
VPAESKLLDVILAFAVARLWPKVLSNAVEPGWVATKMGGPGAPDDLEAGPKTQVWLAGSDGPAASKKAVQDRFLEECARLSGVTLPTA